MLSTNTSPKLDLNRDREQSTFFAQLSENKKKKAPGKNVFKGDHDACGAVGLHTFM